jgi:hypothetical protein
MNVQEEAVIEVIEQAEKTRDNTITLSSGVVLRGKQANPLVLIDVMAAYPRPKPPTYKSPTMGREMENPDDPDYRGRIKSWEAESSSATLNAMILLGTELVSVPNGFPGPHPTVRKKKVQEKDADGKTKTVTVDEEIPPVWLDEYELLGLPMRPQNQSWRYLKWVLFKAVKDEKDLMKIRDVVGRLSGVSERSVESAEQFPGSE